MKTLLLVGGARAGVDLFQSLLDNHEQILQFPGVIYINDDLKKILSNKSKKKVAQTFIKKYSSFFDSRKSYEERHYMLGAKKNKHYKINKKKFVQRFLNFSKNDTLFEKNDLFQNLYLLHKAYDFDYEKKEKKLLVINVHILPFAVNFKSFFKNIDHEIIHTIRHPLSSLSSSIKNWLTYKNGIYMNSKELFYNLDLIFFGIQKLKKLNKKLYIVQLEKLHLNTNNVMKSFCKIYNLKFLSSLKKSTYQNLMWWGDAISVKDLNGINKKFKIIYDLEMFTRSDLYFINSLMEKQLKKYNYEMVVSKKQFFHFMPLKCELIIWKNIINKKQIKNVLLIPYFYLKRVLFFNNFYFKKVELPKSIL